jgi:hypothetical protein
MSERLQERLRNFSYHRPSSEVAAKLDLVRARMHELVVFLDAELPECREKSVTFTHLEDVSMWAIKALVITDPDAVVTSPQPTAG